MRSLRRELIDGGAELRGVAAAFLGVVALDEARRSEFGRSLLRATADGDRLVRWSLRTDTIETVAERLDLAVVARRRAPRR